MKRLLAYTIALVLLQVLTAIFIATTAHGQTVVRTLSNGAMFIAETIKHDSGYLMVLHSGGLESQQRFTVPVNDPDSLGAITLDLFDQPKGAVQYYHGIRLQRMSGMFNLVEISTPDGAFYGNKKVMRKVFGL